MLAKDVGRDHRREVAAILPCIEPILYIHKTLCICIPLHKLKQYCKDRKNAPPSLRLLWALCDQPACLHYCPKDDAGSSSLMAMRRPVVCGPGLYLVGAVRWAQMKHALNRLDSWSYQEICTLKDRRPASLLRTYDIATSRCPA